MSLAMQSYLLAELCRLLQRSLPKRSLRHFAVLRRPTHFFTVFRKPVRRKFQVWAGLSVRYH